MSTWRERGRPRSSPAAPRPRPARRPPPSARGRSGSPSPSCSRRSPPRPHRPAPSAKSKSAHSRLVWARIPNASPLRTPSASRPLASSSTAAAGLVPRDLLPAAGALDEVGGPACGPRRSPRATARPIVRTALELTSGREAQRERRICAVPLHLSTAKRASDANYLERITQLRPGHHPGRPRARDGAEGPCLGRRPSGRCTASAGRRSSRSAGARCTSARSSNDELVKGWEVSKGQFVIVEDADLEAIEQRDTSRAIEISRFVPLAEVDPLFFDRTYFLAPSQRGGAAPALRAAAERDEGDRAWPRSAAW